MSEQRIETICVQGGYTPGNGEPRQIPIVQSTTFKYATSEDMGKLFDLEASGYFYTRLQNPTNDFVAAKICHAGGRHGGYADLVGPGGQFLCPVQYRHLRRPYRGFFSSIYGGTFNLICRHHGQDGHRSAPLSRRTAPAEELDAAFRPNTKAVFGETIANPALTVLDIEKFAAAAHAPRRAPDRGQHLPHACATAGRCEWGADIVTHSTTKYMDGHGTAVGGCHRGRRPVSTGWPTRTSSPACAPRTTAITASPMPSASAKRGPSSPNATAQLMRDLGSIQSPQHALLC